jgi:hypothetical protein
VNIVVDTSVRSLALRRKKESRSANEKSLVAESELIREGRAYCSVVSIPDSNSSRTKPMKN